MTPPDPFEKALDLTLKAFGVWCVDDRGGKSFTDTKAALLAAHRAGQKQLIIRIAREATERTPGETWQDWAWRVAKILKDELAALTPPEPTA